MYVNRLGCHQSDIHNSYRKPFMDLDVTLNSNPRSPPKRESTIQTE